jgi:type IV pilus assembly protein PilC
VTVETFTYKVRDKKGEIIQGEIEADNTTLVAARLRKMGYIPIQIDRKAQGGLSRELKIPGLGNRVKLKELAIFSRQFATMINSGLSLLRSLNILAEQTESKALADVINQIRQDVETGSSLSGSLEKHPKVFNHLYVAMVRSGESGGNLDEVLLRLADTIEKQVALRSKVKSAMTYPIMVGVMVLGITMAMLLFIVPMFKQLYADLGGTLPLPTRVLLKISDILKKFFPVVLVLGVVGGVLFRKWVKGSGKPAWDRLKLKMPIFGVLAQKVALARFARTLAQLVRSGVPILESLEIVSETSGNDVVKTAVLDVQQSVRQGESLSKPLLAHEVFPPMVVQMMSVGEETGALDVMLDKVAVFYEREVEATVESLTSIIEPILIVVMGAIVGSMLIALYMPMFNIIKLIK